MNITSNQPKILVVGSSSVDLILNTEVFPHPNETVMAYKSENFFGGKGANQAVGTARLGASVYFVGCVGMDPLGQQILRNLINEGVNVGFVAESEDAPTGTAYVTAAGGKNSIVVVPAANYALRPQHVDEAEKYFHSCDLILLQLEIPIDVVEHTVQLAKKHGKKVGIYAAPAARLSQEVIDYASFIVVKRSGIEEVFGTDPKTALELHPNKLFMRDDGNCTVCYNGEELRYYRDGDGEVSHKMGMGDAFTSGFAVAFCHGNSVNECVNFGNEVSIKMAQHRGSQAGLPYLQDFI